jgi:hypothetical protein
MDGACPFFGPNLTSLVLPRRLPLMHFDYIALNSFDDHMYGRFLSMPSQNLVS